MTTDDIPTLLIVFWVNFCMGYFGTPLLLKARDRWRNR